MSTKEMMRKSSVKTVLDAANSAIEQIQTSDTNVQSAIALAAALAPVNVPRSGGDDLSAKPGTGGAVLNDVSWWLKDGEDFQLLTFDGSAWQEFGNPLLTIRSNAEGLLSAIIRGTGNYIDPDADYAFLGAGENNRIEKDVQRDTNPAWGSGSGGFRNVNYEYAGALLGGYGNINDGKIGTVGGNTCMNSSNDGSALGNRVVSGRRRYNVTSSGVDTDGDVGEKPFVIIDGRFGDQTSYFPNELTDNITTRYGAGATQDAKGNIYSASHTAATWVGDDVGVANDLRWALHSICVIKGNSESSIGYFPILKAIWDGSNTKIYYDNGGEAYGGAIESIYSSYAPTVPINGYPMGNGAAARGFKNSASGYGAGVDGYLVNAWARGSYGAGESVTIFEQALASIAVGFNINQKGLYAAVFGEIITNLGRATFAGGREMQYLNDYQHGHGYKAVADFLGQSVYAVDDFATPGDSQHSKLNLKRFASGNALRELTIQGGNPTANNQIVLKDDTAYFFTVNMIGRETGGDYGAITLQFKAKRGTGAATVVVSGVTKTYDSTPANWDADAVANTTDGLVSIRAKCNNGADAYWQATVFWEQITPAT